MSNSSSKVKKVQQILWLILLLNWLVAGLKLATGLFFNVISLTADGLHSFLDGSSNIVGLVGLSLSSKPADEDHPYGHAKFETFTSILIGFLILFAAFTVGRASYERIQSKVTPEASPLTFLTIIATIVVNLFVTVYEKRKGKELKSAILIADSEHTRSDLLASFLVSVSLVAITLGFFWVDIIASLLITVLIFIAGGNIIASGLSILSDQARFDSTVIRGIVLQVPGVRHCHKIRSRGSDGSVHLDLHVGVNPDLSTEKAHHLTHHVINILKKTYPEITDVVVHTEPHAH